MFYSIIKIKKVYLVLFLAVCLSFLISEKAGAQNSDTVSISAKVLRIDTIDYYVVLRIRPEGKAIPITVLSPLKERSKTLMGSTDSVMVKVGKRYSFYLVPTMYLKFKEDLYRTVSLKKFYYGSLLLLNEDEVPYIALNMYRYFLFKDVK